MKEYRIYTAGRMNGTTLEEQLKWRIDLKYELSRLCDEPFLVLNPPMYYNYETKSHKSEHEVREWELAQLEQCDIMVVNLKDVEKSVGAITEIATAIAINNHTDRHIYIIGVGDESGLHPWIKDSIFRFEPDINSAATYISEYLFL